MVSINPSERTSKDEYDVIMSVNVRAPFRLTQLAAPHLRKTKGNIVNISSISAFGGVRFVACAGLVMQKKKKNCVYKKNMFFFCKENLAAKKKTLKKCFFFFV